MYLFRLNDLKILTGNRRFKRDGDGFTTDGVFVSIHYQKVSDDDSEDGELSNAIKFPLNGRFYKEAGYMHRMQTM